MGVSDLNETDNIQSELEEQDHYVDKEEKLEHETKRNKASFNRF